MQNVLEYFIDIWKSSVYLYKLYAQKNPYMLEENSLCDKMWASLSYEGGLYEFLQVDASAHIKMEPCMQPNLFYCDFYQYFMKLKEYSLKSENLED